MTNIKRHTTGMQMRAKTTAWRTSTSGKWTMMEIRAWITRRATRWTRMQRQVITEKSWVRGVKTKVSTIAANQSGKKSIFQSKHFHRRRLLEEKAPEKSNNFHDIPATRVGKGVREKSLSRRLFERRVGDEGEPARSSSSGKSFNRTLNVHWRSFWVIKQNLGCFMFLEQQGVFLEDSKNQSI